MTVKRRLFWSNILMIAVPAVSTALIGLLSIYIIWLLMLGGMGFGIEDQEDFEYICMTFSEIIEYDIKNDTGFSSARSVLDSNQMTLTVKSNGKTLFEYGKKKAADEALIAASEFLNGHSTITQEGRGLYICPMRPTSKL